MKLVKYIAVVCVLCILYIVFVPSGCKDASEFERPNDSLVEPPAAPILISPPVDTEYILLQNPGYVNVFFTWNSVIGAEYYQLEYSVDENFGSSSMFTINSTELVESFTEPVDLYWRVRAHSDYWTWFTDWSETWYFRIRPPVD